MRKRTIDTDFKSDLHTLLATARKAIAAGAKPSEALASALLGVLDGAAETLTHNMHPGQTSNDVDMITLDSAAEFTGYFRRVCGG
jgi:Xaa-Pro aminopeptidase